MVSGDLITTTEKAEDIPELDRLVQDRVTCEPAVNTVAHAPSLVSVIDEERVSARRCRTRARSQQCSGAHQTPDYRS